MESIKKEVQALEERLIREALLECGGVVTQAARKLKLAHRTLSAKLHRYRINPDDYRSEGRKTGGYAPNPLARRRVK